MNQIKSIVSLLIDYLPDLANIVLAVVGVLMSFPKAAEEIEKKEWQRKTIAMACILLALAAFFAGGYQRRQSAFVMRGLVINTNSSVDQLKTVVNRTGDLMTNTNMTVTSIGLLAPQMAAVNAHIADLDIKIDAAKEKHDPKLLADLQDQAASARQVFNNLSKDVLLAMVPPITQQLREWSSERKYQEQNLQNYRWDAASRLRDRKASAEEINKVDDEWMKKISDSNDIYQHKLEAIMNNADSLRKIMLLRIPQSNWTNEDKEMDKDFKSREEGTAANYLEKLAKRI
jgi:hypothetical protein